MDTHTPPRNRSQKLGIGGLALLACIAAALIGLVCSPRAAHAAVGDYGTLEDGTYTVSAYLSSWMCWDVVGPSTSNGAKIHSVHHHGAAQQCWKITTDSDGYSTIINVLTGKALDVSYGTVANGKQLQQWEPNGGKNQKWKIFEYSNGYKVASAIDESYVIDLTDYSTADGTAIQICKEGSVTAQRWHIDKVADQTTTVLPDQTKLFDTSVYITDAQAGTYTWETVSDGWEVCDEFYYDNKVKRVKYKNGYYPGGGAVIVLRVDDCGKVNGKSVSLRLTFSNIAGLNDASNLSYFCLETNNVWDSIVTYGIAQTDMKIELFETESGKPISLKGSYLTGASLNYYGIQPEGVRYLAGEPFESNLIKGNGLETKADGTWQGASVLNDLDWEDFPGGKNFFVSAVGFRIVDDSPTFRLYQAIYWYEGSNADAFCFNLSPLTIATPPSPTKSATITG